jgi:thiol-disulfide isomerase/thioredoxin
MFYLSTDMSGPLLVHFERPNHKPFEVALLLEQPITDTIEVTLSQSQGVSRLVFHDPTSLAAKFASLNLKSKMRFARYAKDASTDWGSEPEQIVAALDLETEPALRHELMMQYMELSGFGAKSTSRDSINKWLLEIPPTSPAWVYHSNLAFVFYLNLFEQDGFEHQNSIVAQHPSRYFRARMLYEFASFYEANNEKSKFDSVLTILLSNYSETGWSRKASPRKELKLRVGEPVPAFSLQSIDDTLVYFSDKKMLGRIYLIDFWGTWCPVCVHEMPYLHQAYERFSKRGFTILSISSDASRDAIVKFRKGKWSMPWLNACVGSGGDHPILSAFGIWGYPTPILVNEKGKIVALGLDRLGGEILEPTIEQCIARK